MMTDAYLRDRLTALYGRVLTLWLGAGLAVSFVAIPAVFSPAIKSALPAEAVGQVAQGILGRFFWVQLAVATVAFCLRWILHQRWGRGEQLAWLILGLGTISAATWVHPKLRALHHTKYDVSQPASVRDQAAAEFRVWHGGSQVGNLVMMVSLAGLVIFGGGSQARALRSPWVETTPSPRRTPFKPS